MNPTSATVQRIRRCVGKQIFILAVWALLGPPLASAQENTPFFVFTDDFTDGSVSDDAPVSIVSGGLPSTIEISNGDVVLTEPLQLEGFSLGLTSVTHGGKLVHADDVSAQAVVRVSDLLTVAGLYTRAQSLENGGDGGAYFGNIRGDGLIKTGSFTGQTVTLETSLNPVDTDIVLQVDSVDTHVITTAWAADNPNEKYSLTFVDTVARPAGYMGQSFGRLGDDATGSSATFRSFQVLESSFVAFIPFTDDFTDGSVSDDAPVSIVSGGLPSTIEISNGDVVLTEPLQLEGFSLGLTSVTHGGKLVHADDVSTQAVVRVSDEFTIAGLYTRAQNLENGGDGGAYFGNIRGDGLINTGSFTGQTVALETPLNPVDTDIVLQVETVDTHVITTAWAADNPNEKYSLTFVDAVARPAGFMGQSFGRVGDDATGASATFRSFQVLESSFVAFIPFTDDFTDGSVSDDAPVSIVSGGLPSTIEISNGDVVLTEPLQLEGFSLGLTSVTHGGKLVHADDVSTQAVVRVSDLLTVAGLYTRAQSLENGGDGGAYFGNIRGDGLINTGSFTGQTVTLETPLNPVDTDIVLQVETVDTHVITTAWAADNPNEKYSLTFVDAVARPAGFMGQSFGRVGDDATGASATFRSFEVVKAVASPTLSIERAMILSWPLDAAGYVLVGANHVNGPWFEIDAEVRVEGGESMVTLRANQQARFYQLEAR